MCDDYKIEFPLVSRFLLLLAILNKYYYRNTYYYFIFGRHFLRQYRNFPILYRLGLLLISTFSHHMFVITY
jgi:hypothetical protein